MCEHVLRNPCRRALTLALLLAGAAAAAGACVEFETDVDSDCTKCSADGSKCVECQETWALTAAGACIKCDVTTIGPWKETCRTCKPEDPTFCLDCQDYCNSRGCNGYFVTSTGGCSKCPVGAASCSDITGEITSCRNGLGLVGGECHSCRVAGCQKCDGDVSFCTQCFTPRAWGRDGLYPDPETGECKPCDAGCRTCTGPGECSECASTVLDPVTKKCSACTVDNCKDCTLSLGTCAGCQNGYRLDEASNTCQPCSVVNCEKCDDDTAACSSCQPGYGLMSDGKECRRCASAEAGCTSCDDNPDICQYCEEGVGGVERFPDPTNPGTCVPCQAQHCFMCANATHCDENYCTDGYYYEEATGLCTPCGVPGCASCSQEPPNKCDVFLNEFGCLLNFWWDEAAHACKSCADAACEVCDVSLGQNCERCQDGYYLESATKLCKQARGVCTEADVIQYPSCAAGKAGQAPGAGLPMASADTGAE